MALVTRECHSGHLWDDLVGVVAAPETHLCPVCGQPGRKLVSLPAKAIVCGTETMTAGEMALARENKASIEARASEIRSGAVEVSTASTVPLELRPSLPKTIY